jgi:hypothetical protein
MGARGDVNVAAGQVAGFGRTAPRLWVGSLLPLGLVSVATISIALALLARERRVDGWRRRA